MQKSRRRRDGKKMRGGTLLGLALGLCVGVLISFGVVWYLNKTPLPFVEKVTKPEAKPGDAATPLLLPGKPGDKPIEKTGERKFEFYDILEGKKDPVPEAGAPVSPAAPTAAETAGERLFLQAGAFQKQGDAENLKARLAMLGLEAGILAAEVPGKGTLHRVRVGPYAGTAQMNQARELLSQNGIRATVVRVKE